MLLTPGSQHLSLRPSAPLPDPDRLHSIQVSRWPQSICIQLFERHTLRDTYIGQVG